MQQLEAAGAWLGRLLLAAIFLHEAWAKLTAYGMAVTYMEAFGLPGWLLPFAFFTLVSILVAAGGWLEWAGFSLFCVLFAVLLMQGLKFALFRRKLRRTRNKLSQLLASAGIPEEERGKECQRIIQQASAGTTQMPSELAALPQDRREAIVNFVQQELQPLLKGPVQATETGLSTASRWRSEFSRALVLALFVLLWFFIVPVPGLLVFIADEYRFSLRLGTILLLVMGTIGFVLIASWMGRFIQWLDEGMGRRALRPRIEKAYQTFQALALVGGKLRAIDVARTFALFTDLQTYMDQRSYAYARHCLALIERNLSRAPTVNR